MSSFDYQKKIKQEFLEEKKKNFKALLFKMLKLTVLDLFFHWNKCFCYYTESKVPKKGTGGYRYRISGTDTVPVQMWTIPNPSLDHLQNIFCWVPQKKDNHRGFIWHYGE